MEDESGRRHELMAEDNLYKVGTERETSEMPADEEERIGKGHRKSLGEKSIRWNWKRQMSGI